MNNEQNTRDNQAVNNSQITEPDTADTSRSQSSGYPPYYYNYYRKKSSNTGLVIAVAVLGAVIVAAGIFSVLWFSGIINRVIAPKSEDPAAVTQEAQPPVAGVTTMYVANVKNSIYFRSSPTEAEANIICEIPLGTPVVFMDNSDAIFAKIIFNGSEGYVKREYLSSSAPQSHSNAQSATDGKTSVEYYVYVANVKSSIYLRSKPAENKSNIICEIPVGTRVGFVEYTNNTFSKIYYDGKYGYAKTEYLSGSYSGYNPVYMTVSNVKTSIYLRKTPAEVSNNIICEIPVNSVVEFLENANGTFYKIRWNDTIGYAKSEYLR